ncbi:MAG TPA: hypothetical protein VGO40_22095 [Longimicrobium sp.]|nr:hypothetical protein [Longimicrobium sp.]
MRGLLAAAVAAWVRPSASGDSQSAEGAPRRVYVDAFAGAELQFGTGVLREAAEPTRAQAAVRAIEEACAGGAPCPISLFVEEDPAHLQRIYGDLEDAIGGERLRATRDFASLAAGEASLVEAPFASVAGDVARFAADGRAFFWLAPATARAMPWTAVEPLLAIRDATLLIRFPHADFEKQSRHVGALADLPAFARRIVEGCSSLLADGKHGWLSIWRTEARDGTAELPGVLERFRALLAGAAGERMVKPIELQSADGGRAWCFLVTADAAVGLAVEGDGVAGSAVEREVAPAEPTPVPRRVRAAALRTAAISAPTPATEAADAAAAIPDSTREVPHRDVPVEPPPPVPAPAAPVAEPHPDQVLDLFPDDVAPPTAAPARPEVALGAEVEARFGSRTVTWGEVLASYAARGVSAEAVKAALRHLRRGGRAIYASIRRDTDEIVFPPEPVAPAKANRHAKTPVDDGLFGSGE